MIVEKLVDLFWLTLFGQTFSVPPLLESPAAYSRKPYAHLIV